MSPTAEIYELISGNCPAPLGERTNPKITVMLSSNQVLAVHFHEDFIDVKGVAVATMLTLQAAGINGSEFDTAKADCPIFYGIN